MMLSNLLEDEKDITLLLPKIGFLLLGEAQRCLGMGWGGALALDQRVN